MSETVPASVPPEFAAPASQTAETPVTSTRPRTKPLGPPRRTFPGSRQSRPRPNARSTRRHRCLITMPNAPRACSRTSGRPGPDSKVEGFPDHSIVVCVGGCIKNDVGIVYAEPKARVIKTGGEMIPPPRGPTTHPRTQPCRHRQPPSNVWRAVMTAPLAATGLLLQPTCNAKSKMRRRPPSRAQTASCRTRRPRRMIGKRPHRSPSLKPRTRHRAASAAVIGLPALNAAAPRRNERK